MVNQDSLLNGGEPLEIERKFLIEYPDTRFLEELGCEKIEIWQDYLPNINNKIRRVRKAIIKGKTKYFYTEKFRLSDTVGIEREKEISKEEYEELFKQVAQNAKTIIKTRYFLKKDDLYFEIDIYPEWKTKALVEVELSTETSVVKLPEWMKVIREVTGDKHFKNEWMAFNGFDI